MYVGTMNSPLQAMPRGYCVDGPLCCPAVAVDTLLSVCPVCNVGQEYHTHTHTQPLLVYLCAIEAVTISTLPAPVPTTSSSPTNNMAVTISSPFNGRTSCLHTTRGGGREKKGFKTQLVCHSNYLFSCSSIRQFHWLALVPCADHLGQLLNTLWALFVGGVSEEVGGAWRL